MKKIKFIAMGLALPLFSSPCLGQTRDCDLELTWLSPVNGAVIPYGEAYAFTGTIKNNGPDDIIAGDTIWYATAINEQGPAGTIVEKGIPKDGSVEIVFFTFTNQNTSGEDQPFDEFCAVVYDPHFFFDKPIWKDPDTSNNLDCTSFILGASGGSSSVSSHEVSNLQLTCYPNPATDKISLSLASFEGRASSIRMIDISGREVLRKEARELQPTADHSVVLDVSAISAGTYFVEVQSDRDKAITKVVLLER